MQAVLLQVSSVVAGANAVIGNVGVAISVVAGNAPIRLTKLSWRVDLAPDVAAGTVSAPTRWRVFVVVGQLPQDLTSLQTQAYPTGSHPEIPANTAAGSPLPMYWDVWLDFTAGDAGLNELVSEFWSDSGPTASQGETLNCVIVPVIDAQMDQSVIGSSNAQIVLAASGLAMSPGQAGGNASGSKSLPRWDV